MSESRGGSDARRTWRLTVLLPSIVAVVLIGVAFCLTSARVFALEMESNPPVWVIDAVPAALSELYFGHPKRYTILTTVRERYFDSLPDRNVNAKAINL